MAGQVKHAKIFSGIVPDLTLLSVLTTAEGPKHRCAHLRGGRRAARRGHRAARFDRVPAAAAGRRGTSDRTPLRTKMSAPTSRSATGWPTPWRRSISARRSRSRTRRWSRSRRWRARTRRSRRAGRARRAWRARRQGGQAESGHALRRAGRRHWPRSRRWRAAGATALSIDAGQTLVHRRRPRVHAAPECIVGRQLASHRPRRRSETAVPAEPLRVAVVGVGHLGRHHARILSDARGRPAGRRSSTSMHERAEAAAAASGTRAPDRLPRAGSGRSMR